MFSHFEIKRVAFNLSAVKRFFSKLEQIRNFLRICSHLLKKHLIENFMFSFRKIVNHNDNFSKPITVF